VFYLIVLMVAAAVAWSAVSQVDRLVVGNGKLVPTATNFTVQPIETSIIRSVNVEVGQIVRKGTPLVALDPTFTEADVDQLQQRIASYEIQIARLAAEASGSAMARPKSATAAEFEMHNQMLEGSRAENAARRRQHDQKIAELTASLDKNKLDREMLRDRLHSFREIESMRQQLYKSQHGSRLQALIAEKERIDADRAYQLEVKRTAELRHQLDGAISARRAYVEETRRKIAETLISVRRERDALMEQLNKALKRRELVVLRAPDDALVLEIAAKSVGSVVREAEPLVTMLPLDAPLRADVQVRARDIGLLRVGDRVRLKLEAFPFQRHGTLDGEIETISGDTFTNQKDDKAEPFYRVRIRLLGTRLKTVPDDFRLIPGMLLTADIKIGERSVLSYFTYPIIRTLDEAIREP
jgi:HlyD family secretion protein